MKSKVHILISIFIICQGLIATAQFHPDSTFSNKISTKNNILKTNPLAIIQGSVPYTAEYRIMFEHVLNNESSFQLSGSYLGKSFYLNLIEASASDPIRYVVKGYRFQTEYKYYISTLLQHKKAPEGLYIAPAYSFSRAKITSRYYNASDKYISLTYSNYCLKIGYQFVNNTLVFDTFIGAGYRDNIWVDYINNPGTVIDEKEYTIYPGHLKLLIGFNIGYAF